jgi:hypothetical protein
MHERNITIQDITDISNSIIDTIKELKNEFNRCGVVRFHVYSDCNMEGLSNGKDCEYSTGFIHVRTDVYFMINQCDDIIERFAKETGTVKDEIHVRVEYDPRD